MNKNLLQASLLASVAVLFFVGCGPQDFNTETQNVNAAEDQGMAPQGPQAPQDMQGGGEQGQAPQAREGGCPTGGCAAAQAGGSGGCASGNCEVAPDPDTHRKVRLADVHKTEATKIVPTGEKQYATDTVEYHTRHQVNQPTARYHTVEKHRTNINVHHTEVILRPSFIRYNRVINSASSQNQVMPTVTRVAPPVDLGCHGAPEATPAATPVVAAAPVVYTPVYYVWPYYTGMYY